MMVEEAFSERPKLASTFLAFSCIPSLASMSEETLRMADWSLDVDCLRLERAISCSVGSCRSSKSAFTSSSSVSSFGGSEAGSDDDASAWD